MTNPDAVDNTEEELRLDEVAPEPQKSIEELQKELALENARDLVADLKNQKAYVEQKREEGLAQVSEEYLKAPFCENFDRHLAQLTQQIAEAEQALAELEAS